MTGTQPARGIKAGIERFRLGDRPDVAVLYPDVCFASLEAVGDMPGSLLVESVLEGWKPESDLTTSHAARPGAPFPVASLVVSRDGQQQFHPELSNREPVEIQVWADGRVTLEVEFQGADVQAVSELWAQTVRRILAAWAGTWGIELVAVFNDRARSLPDVWNATFGVDAGTATVRRLVELGERAVRTAQLSMTGWGSEEDVRRLLRDGDAHAVLGWPESAVLQFWPALPGPDEEWRFAADVCAFANSVRGGTVVVGVDGPELVPVPAGDHEAVLERVVREQLFPVPERFSVRRLPVSESGEGLLVVQVPPQDELVQPFLVHAGGRIALFERDGAETVARSVAAVHAALSAGAALLRRPRPD